ncbi:MAG: energy-coupling factor transporter transmembrane protein EcfT [Lachnospiraceae bacterium]|nr:energy-coupling factor transporter transmembrane protein EcfT [Lachnospiraceae bacterium]
MRSLNPACKFTGLLAVTFVLAWRHDPVLNLIVSVLSILLILSARVKVKSLLLFMSPVLLFAVGMFFTGFYFSAGSDMPVNEKTMAFASSSFWNGLTLASRVLAFAGIGYLFALTTDRILLVRSFQKQFHLPQIFAYGLLAAWGILPHMMQEYRRTRAAFQARGIRTFAVSPALLGPLLVKSVRWSEELSIAMESKGFSGHEKRTDFQPVRVHGYDWFFLGLCIIVFPVAAVFV